MGGCIIKINNTPPPCITKFNNTPPPHVLFSKIIHGYLLRQSFYKTFKMLSLTYIHVTTEQARLGKPSSTPIGFILTPPSTPVSLPGPVRYIRFAVNIAIHVKNLYNIYQFFNINLTFIS